MKSKLCTSFMIFFLVGFSCGNPVDLKDEKKGFTIEEAALNQLPVASFSGIWISDNEIQYLDKKTKDVLVLDVAKNQTQIVLKGSILEKYNTTKYSFSGDRNFVLISYDEKAIYRHSKTAKYVVYSIKNGKYYDVSCKEEIQLAEWGPVDNVLAYIKQNNIYLIKKITDKMESEQITSDGSPGVIFNGMGDWVYEEEILSSGRAIWFSPNGIKLSFARFEDKDVKKAIIPEYGEPRDFKNQYVEKVEFPYPKAGTKNPTHKLLYTKMNQTNLYTYITESTPGREILHDMKWINDDVVLFVKSNRVQNESKVFMCNLNAQCKTLFEDNNPKGWANTNMPVVSKKLDKILRIEGVPVGESGKFKHLKMYVNGSSYALTGGYSEVIKINYWDENNKIIYYSATEEFNATTTQIFAVNEANGSKPVCLSCRIKSPEGRGCKEASALFSKKGSYLVLFCNGPDPRTVYLFKNVQSLDKPIRILEDNAKLRSSLEKKLMPEIMSFTVEVPGPFQADVRLFLPPKMDKSGKTKYPLVIYVYGGPNSKNINDAFKIDWGYYLSTNLSIIYGLIDGRNTMRKGENMLFSGYRALGTFEMEDQINVTRNLQRKFPFIDSTRSGIWGWSYGGYATTKILELDTGNTFKCGIAVAPVADWMYYDSMYTERYLGTPQENPKGYETSSVLKDVSNLRNKKYFLIHGNADDNVHYQNAMMIAKLLERKNIPFELMSYPDENHSLGTVRTHLYYTMDRFWKNCFKMTS